MRLLPCILLIALIPLMNSCRTSPVDNPAVFISDTTALDLLPPDAMNGTVDELQQIKAEWKGKTFTMNAYLLADVESLVLVAMGDMGQQLFEISYNSDGVAMRGSPGTGSIDPNYILLDMQMAYYSGARLESHLKKQGLVFREEKDVDNVLRIVEERGNRLYTIDIAAREISIVNHLRKYEYTVTRESSVD